MVSSVVSSYRVLDSLILFVTNELLKICTPWTDQIDHDLDHLVPHLPL